MRRLVLRPQSALLRFSRWSRSGAATFRSLGREVSIRTLSVGVLRLLERKTQTLLEGMQAEGLEYMALYSQQSEEEVSADEETLLCGSLALEPAQPAQRGRAESLL